jgi:hypothetical protein
LIYINVQGAPASIMLHMSKVRIMVSGIARSAAILAVLLLAPLTASAAGSAAHFRLPTGTEHGSAGNYRVAPPPGTVRHVTPTDTPLHCHLMYHPVQADGLSQKPVENDLPLLALIPAAVPAPKTETRLPVDSTQVFNAAPPRFILFGNFRS